MFQRDPAKAVHSIEFNSEISSIKMWQKNRIAHDHLSVDLSGGQEPWLSWGSVDVSCRIVNKRYPDGSDYLAHLFSGPLSLGRSRPFRQGTTTYGCDDKMARTVDTIDGLTPFVLLGLVPLLMLVGTVKAARVWSRLQRVSLPALILFFTAMTLLAGWFWLAAMAHTPGLCADVGGIGRVVRCHVSKDCVQNGLTAVGN